MKPNQLATLALRLMGIYCLIASIPAVWTAIAAVTFAQAPPAGASRNGADLSLIMLVVLPFLSRVVIGILLLIYSIPWGEKLTAKDDDAAGTTAISFEQIQALAFAIAGVLIFAHALSSLFTSVFNLAEWYAIRQRLPENSPIYFSRNVLTAFGTFAEAAFGGWLFFGARGFAHFWRSLKNFGTPKPPAE